MRHLFLPVSLATAATITAAHAHGQYGYDWGHEHMWGGGWAAMVIGPLMMILVVAGVIAGIVLLVRWLGGGEPRRGRRSALDILEERFAKGEIDKAEFEERRRALEG